MSRCGTRWKDDRSPLLEPGAKPDPRGNLAGCKAHTRPGNSPEDPEIRLGLCNRACWVMVDAAAATQPLTRLLILLGKASDADLKKTSPAALAAKFNVRHDWAASYLRMEREGRGMRE